MTTKNSMTMYLILNRYTTYHGHVPFPPRRSEVEVVGN